MQVFLELQNIKEEYLKGQISLAEENHPNLQLCILETFSQLFVKSYECQIRNEKLQYQCVKILHSDFSFLSSQMQKINYTHSSQM